jgi:esterase/lipase
MIGEGETDLYFYEYPGHGFRYRTSFLGDMETWYKDISALYYSFRSSYPSTTQIIFLGFSWGGYIAASVASHLAITPSPVDHVLLVAPFSHYADVGKLGRFFSTRTESLLGNLSIPQQQHHSWHVLLFNSDATINKSSKDKWRPLSSITVIEDKPSYDKMTHNTLIGSEPYNQWIRNSLSTSIEQINGT